LLHDNLPQLNRKRFITGLKKAGISIVRVRGSHHFVQHPDGRSTVVPVHAGENIGPGLISKILRDRELSREQLQKLLWVGLIHAIRARHFIARVRKISIISTMKKTGVRPSSNKNVNCKA
jgi:predicted RNA binding protein YcfA (HicA-like mRNA interferase family)